jgi:hypothetical protein
MFLNQSKCNVSCQSINKRLCVCVLLCEFLQVLLNCQSMLNEHIAIQYNSEQNVINQLDV